MSLAPSRESPIATRQLIRNLQMDIGRLEEDLFRTNERCARLQTEVQRLRSGSRILDASPSRIAGDEVRTRHRLSSPILRYGGRKTKRRRKRKKSKKRRRRR